jgi:Flp pilus assembly protein TadD
MLVAALAPDPSVGAPRPRSAATDPAPSPLPEAIPIRFAVDAWLAVPGEAWRLDGLPDGSRSTFHEEPNRLLAGRRLAADLVAGANRLLAPSLGRSFALAEVSLWSVAGDSLESRLDDLRTKVVRAPGRITAGLTGPLDQRRGMGLASYREGLLVVAVPSDRDPAVRLFAHELAHLFGAVHLPGEGILMAASVPGSALDPLTVRLLRLHRDRPFDPHLFPLPPGALEAARSAYVEAASRSGEADALLAQIALEQGDTEGALEVADRALGRDPGDVDAHLVRGIALRRRGRTAEAVKEYEWVRERRPSYAAVHYDLAIALDHLGQSDRALAAYERAVELDPANASAFSNLARLLARRGAADRALAAARRALDLAPDFAGARVNLAMAYLAAGETAPAEAAARQAVAERPDLADAHEALGAALLAGGRPEDAAASFRKASELKPDEPRFRDQEAVALRSLARLRRRAGDLDGAQAALERASRLAPADAEAWSERADLSFERGRQAEAREAYTRLLALRPDDAAAHNNLAVVLFRSGDVAGARRHVEAAQRLGLTVHPDFLRALAATEPR